MINLKLSIYMPLNSRKYELPGFSTDRNRLVMYDSRYENCCSFM